MKKKNQAIIPLAIIISLFLVAMLGRHISKKFEEYKNEIKSEGYSQGYEKGKEDGTAEAKKDIKEEKKSSYDAGYEAGITEGTKKLREEKKSSYDAGYKAGVREGKKKTNTQSSDIIWEDDLGKKYLDPRGEVPSGYFDEDSDDYVLNKNSMKFHHTWCASVNTISDSNREDIHCNRDDLVKKGYSPCKRCNP